MDEKEESRRESPDFDPTLPGTFRTSGIPHPILSLKRRVEGILFDMGFAVEDGGEIQNLYDFFQALNTSPDQPDEEAGEPFRIDEERILRAHAFPALIRAAQNRKPPIQIAFCGKVYQRVAPSLERLPQGFDFQALLIDKGITFAHLKGAVEAFLKSLYPEKRALRFRPLSLPYAGPAVSVEISCSLCRGRGEDCPLCGGRGGLELVHAGMIDPQVFKQMSIDPERFSGFAFGMSIDQAARLFYREPDLTILYRNDAKVLSEINHP